MGRKNKYTKDTKLKAIQEYINGVKSINVICRELKCSYIKFYDWVKMFNKYGESIFEDKPHNSHYSKEFKEQAIKEYLAGEGSLRDIQLKYKILSPETLRKWILKYNNDIIN